MLQKSIRVADTSLPAIADKEEPSVVIPTPEADRHGFGVDLSLDEISAMSSSLGDASRERTSSGRLSAAERDFYADQAKFF